MVALNPPADGPASRQIRNSRYRPEWRRPPAATFLPLRVQKNARSDKNPPLAGVISWMPGTSPGMTASCEIKELRHGRACPGHPRSVQIPALRQ
jgi:hypothetical protein